MWAKFLPRLALFGQSTLGGLAKGGMSVFLRWPSLLQARSFAIWRSLWNQGQPASFWLGFGPQSATSYSVWPTEQLRPNDRILEST